MSCAFGYRAQISLDPSVEAWSATRITSANTLVTERNRSRIQASFRTGVRTTMAGVTSRVTARC